MLAQATVSTASDCQSYLTLLSDTGTDTGLAFEGVEVPEKVYSSLPLRGEEHAAKGSYAVDEWETGETFIVVTR
jgi:hypothetical protein